MKRRRSEEGQGFVEYALILGLVAVVVLVIGALVFSPKTPYVPPQPPAVNAPLLEIVRWCETHARERKTRAVTSPMMVGKIMTVQTRTQVYHVDAPDKFLACMQGYEYQVER